MISPRNLGLRNGSPPEILIFFMPASSKAAKHVCVTERYGFGGFIGMKTKLAGVVALAMEEVIHREGNDFA
jgi:hypothetical protein